MGWGSGKRAMAESSLALTLRQSQQPTQNQRVRSRIHLSLSLSLTLEPCNATTLLQASLNYGTLDTENLTQPKLCLVWSSEDGCGNDSLELGHSHCGHRLWQLQHLHRPAVQGTTSGIPTTWNQSQTNTTNELQARTQRRSSGNP